MTEIVSIVDNNPATFFQQLESYINAGYYADDSLTGHPHFGTLNTIVLKEIDEPQKINDYSAGNEVLIQEFGNSELVLAVQDAILQGFTVDLQHILLNQYCAPHEIRLTTKAAVKLNLAPVKADPVPEPTSKAENVPQSPTEPPKAIKVGRPRKDKTQGE